MLICWTAAVVPASAQHFKQIDGSLTQIAVGRAEVWGLNGSKIYRFDAGTEKFGEISGSLAQIAVGGGSLLQRDEVWGVNASGEIFHFNFSKNKFATVPGTLTKIAVGEGDNDNCHPYEVWGVDAGGNVWRYNYCKSELEEFRLKNSVAQIAVGPNDVWGIDDSGNITHFSGTSVGGASVANNAPLQQISVGVNDVWGTDSNGALYRYNASDSSFDNVCNSLTTPSCQVGQVAAAGDGVWVDHLYQQGVFTYVGIAHLTFSTANSFASFEFFNDVFSVPVGAKSVVQIAVGSGGGVWAITSHPGLKFTTTYQVYTWVRP
jgi:hypothetical protein